MRMIKMAIMGAGTIANKMALTITTMSSVEAYAIAARDEDCAKAFADTYGFVEAYGSYKEMLADDAIDFVYVAVPHSHHFKCMKMCLEAGKNVLCEKPFTVNAKQTRLILDFAKEKHLLVAEAMWTRYMPSRRIIDDIIASGVIGDVTSLTASLGYELSDVKRIWDKNLAAGALLDVGCYLVNFAKMIFSGDITDTYASDVFRDGVDAIDTISLMFDNSKMATMQCSVVAAQNRRGDIFGTKGYIEVTNINNPELIEVYDLN
ncbi:MAG: Gfo/Idh/MocA family oxidoreductase [Sphaerochaeta sp.]